MKTIQIILLSFLLLAPMAASSAPYQGERQTFNIPSEKLTTRFSTAGSPNYYEYGCPIREVVEAKSEAEALNKIAEECVAEVRSVVSEKRFVTDIIKVDVIVSDVIVEKAKNGFLMVGTFFISTAVYERIAKGSVPNE